MEISRLESLIREKLEKEYELPYGFEQAVNALVGDVILSAEPERELERILER